MLLGLKWWSDLLKSMGVCSSMQVDLSLKKNQAPCLSYYSSSLNIEPPAAQNLCDELIQAGQHSIWCQMALPFPCVYPPGSRGQLLLSYSGYLLMALLSLPETRVFQGTLDCTGNHWNCWEQRQSVSFPSPDVRARSLLTPYPPHRNSCEEERLKRGPSNFSKERNSPKTIHRLVVPSVHYL